MGSFSLAGTLSIPDPDWQSYGTPVRGAFVGGGFVRQGKESGMLKFPPLTEAHMSALYARWQANKNGLVGGALPSNTGTWDAVTAAWGEPQPTGWDGPLAMGVTMTVAQVVRY